jgi:aspartate carbamoyltransferase regulatory subunit
MAKLTKEELISKINDADISEEFKISLMEDISDSFDANDEEVVTKEEFEGITSKYEELLTKYKERFLDSKEEVKEEVKEDNGYEEKEVIDVKEI